MQTRSQASRKQAGLTAIQLHGGSNPALAEELQRRFEGRISLIQTIHWRVDADGSSAATVSRQLAQLNADGVIDRVLIDSKVGQATGGTGITFNWDEAHSVLTQSAGRLKLIVAGGLRTGERRRGYSRAQSLGSRRRQAASRPRPAEKTPNDSPHSSGMPASREQLQSNSFSDQDSSRR